MKKAVTMVLTAVFVLSGSMTALAANGNHGICHHEYVDADHSGECDYGDVHHEYVDADHSGTCDYGDIHCAQYVDDDGDGLCDNCLAATAYQEVSGSGNGVNTVQAVYSGNGADGASVSGGGHHGSSGHRSHGGHHH